MITNEKVKSAILGAILADAVGVPYEFKERDTFEATDMIGHGTYDQPVGTWSDDSSMMLCIIDSFIRGYSPEDLKATFRKWLLEGYMTPHDEVFDKGITTENALLDIPTFDKSSERANGNGSLMRTLPLAFVEYVGQTQYTNLIYEVSGITHNHIRAKFACLLYCMIARSVAEGRDFESVYKNVIRSLRIECMKEGELDSFKRIIMGDILTVDRNEIKSYGYVIDTLEASLWCIHNSSSYKEAVLKAINLGEDTDTTACVVGGLAGMIWGVPEDWKQKLVRLDQIEDMIDKFCEKR